MRIPVGDSGAWIKKKNVKFMHRHVPTCAQCSSAPGF